MSSKRVEEKNEKIIRGLMKLPPNRRCINCNSMGPQYVCVDFWTFVCTTCSGIHREFTHRVKSVSMAKFTSKEVESLQNGGNQRAKEIYLSDWDFQRMRLPDSSNPDRIREFIRNVYVDKKYAGGRSSDKPPRNIQTQKSFEEDHRRASSYHSYSQSPPYDYQYEDRVYGKQSGMLTRKPGSDRGGLGKISNLIYSPGRQDEDRFSSEISGPRLSDFSLSSASESIKFDSQSPNFQSNPQQVRDILIEEGRCHAPRRNAETVVHPQRSSSLGSLGSLKSDYSGGSHDMVIEALPSIRSQQESASFQPSSPLDIFAGAQYCSTSLFDNPGSQAISALQTAASSSSVSLDLFSEITLDPSKREPFPEKEGWAKFDSPASGSVIGLKPTSFLPGNHTQMSLEPSQLTSSQWSSGTSGVDFSSEVTTLQTWNAFDDSLGGLSLSSFERSVPRSETSVPPSAVAQQIELKFQKDFVGDGLGIPSIDDRAAGSSFNKVTHSTGINNRESRSTNPFDVPYDSDPEPVKFLDLSSLQETLPSAPFPPPLIGNLGQTWFPQNPMPPYAAPVASTGSLMQFPGGQPLSSQLPDLPSQGPVSILRGNPFA